MNHCDANSMTIHEWPSVKTLVMKYVTDADSVYNDTALTDEQKAQRINHLTNNFGN